MLTKETKKNSNKSTRLIKFYLLVTFESNTINKDLLDMVQKINHKIILNILSQIPLIHTTVLLKLIKIKLTTIILNKNPLIIVVIRNLKVGKIYPNGKKLFIKCLNHKWVHHQENRITIIVAATTMTILDKTYNPNLTKCKEKIQKKFLRGEKKSEK